MSSPDRLSMLFPFRGSRDRRHILVFNLFWAEAQWTTCGDAVLPCRISTFDSHSQSFFYGGPPAFAKSFLTSRRLSQVTTEPVQVLASGNFCLHGVLQPVPATTR